MNEYTLLQLLNHYEICLPDFKDIEKFIACKQLDLGYEAFCAQLYECDIKITFEYYEKIFSCGKSLQVSPLTWESLWGLIKSYPCVCCGFLTISDPESGSYEICDICNWEDDDVQFRDLDFSVGANEESLRLARENFKKIGVSSLRFLKEVRAPKPDEIPSEFLKCSTKRLQLWKLYERVWI